MGAHDQAWSDTADSISFLKDGLGGLFSKEGRRTTRNLGEMLARGLVGDPRAEEAAQAEEARRWDAGAREAQYRNAVLAAQAYALIANDLAGELKIPRSVIERKVVEYMGKLGQYNTSARTLAFLDTGREDAVAYNKRVDEDAEKLDPAAFQEKYGCHPDDRARAARNTQDWREYYMKADKVYDNILFFVGAQSQGAPTRRPHFLDWLNARRALAKMESEQKTKDGPATKHAEHPVYYPLECVD